MEIILSSNCKSLTGSLGRGFGYSIQRRKNRFFTKRDSKGIIPPDGHWRFIVACAELAVAARAKDLNKMGPDKTVFNAQKDQPGGKKTMKSYLWSLELAAWDQAHPQG